MDLRSGGPPLATLLIHHVYNWVISTAEKTASDDGTIGS